MVKLISSTSGVGRIRSELSDAYHEAWVTDRNYRNLYPIVKEKSTILIEDGKQRLSLVLDALKERGMKVVQARNNRDKRLKTNYLYEVWRVSSGEWGFNVSIRYGVINYRTVYASASVLIVNDMSYHISRNIGRLFRNIFSTGDEDECSKAVEEFADYVSRLFVILTRKREEAASPESKHNEVVEEITEVLKGDRWSLWEDPPRTSTNSNEISTELAFTRSEYDLTAIYVPVRTYRNDRLWPERTHDLEEIERFDPEDRHVTKVNMAAISRRDLEKYNEFYPICHGDWPMPQKARRGEYQDAAIIAQFVVDQAQHGKQRHRIVIRNARAEKEAAKRRKKRERQRLLQERLNEKAREVGMIIDEDALNSIDWA